nr:hypothetical protein [Staphylococcus aureus]
MSNTQKKNVPELRFPEFEGEWEEKKLGNLTTKIGSGKTPKGGSEKLYKQRHTIFKESKY